MSQRPRRWVCQVARLSHLPVLSRSLLRQWASREIGGWPRSQPQHEEQCGLEQRSRSNRDKNLNNVSPAHRARNVSSIPDFYKLPERTSFPVGPYERYGRLLRQEHSTSSPTNCRRRVPFYHL